MRYPKFQRAKQSPYYHLRKEYTTFKLAKIAINCADILIHSLKAVLRQSLLTQSLAGQSMMARKSAVLRHSPYCSNYGNQFQEGNKVWERSSPGKVYFPRPELGSVIDSVLFSQWLCETFILGCHPPPPNVIIFCSWVLKFTENK